MIIKVGNLWKFMKDDKFNRIKSWEFHKNVRKN